MKSLSGSRKGFVFTILTLVIIVFMIIELNIYFRTYELKLESEPGKLRLQVMNDFIKEYSPYHFNETTQMFVYSAVYSLNLDSVRYPPQRANLAELIWNISYYGTRTDSHTAALIPPSKTLSAYDSKLRALAESMGIDLDVSYSGFSVNLVDPWTLQYNFTMDLDISDSGSETRISSAQNVSFDIPINGFEDPFLSRMNFTRNIVPLDENPRIRILFEGESGRGWFYGEPVRVYSSNDVNFTPENKHKIMVTDNIGVAREFGALYGAVVLAGSSSVPSVDVPLFIDSDAAIADIPAYAFLIVSDDDDDVTGTGSTHYHYLIDNSALRSMIECGLYIESSANYDYLQRLTNETSGVSGPYGIETIVSGSSSLIKYPSKSYVDKLYYATSSGSKFKGLPGCSSELMCGFTDPYPVRLDSNLDTTSNYFINSTVRDRLKAN